MSSRKPERDPHGWNSYENYLAVHEKCMESFSHYFVEWDSLLFTPLPPSGVSLTGSIYCHGGLVLHVEKTLEVNNRKQVRGLKYRCQAQFADPPSREIFRYDNAHDYPEHPDSFHKLVFSPISWKPVFPPKHIGIDSWPTLREVLDELHQWWLDHKDDPGIYP